MVKTAAGSATTKKTSGTKAAGTSRARTTSGSKASGTKAAGTGRSRSKSGSSQSSGALAGIDKAREHLNGADTGGNTDNSQQGAGITDTTEASQGAGEMSQGAGTSSGEMRGGTKQVLIEVVPMGNKGGRSRGTEDYPFGQLEPSEIKDGQIVGPSFFIPDTDKPRMKIAVARKRYKPEGRMFLTRQTEAVIDGKNVTGVRVWRGLPGMK
jgi:hypothetical protein